MCLTALSVGDRALPIGKIWACRSGQTNRRIVFLMAFLTRNRPFGLRMEGQRLSSRSSERDGLRMRTAVSSVGTCEVPIGAKTGWP